MAPCAMASLAMRPPARLPVPVLILATVCAGLRPSVLRGGLQLLHRESFENVGDEVGPWLSPSNLSQSSVALFSVNRSSLHIIAASRQASEGQDPRPVCQEPFDPCWTGAAWRVTPTCSGAPGTWEAVLFSDGLGKICEAGGAGPPEGLKCSKLGGMCQARKLILDRGCQPSTSLKAISSGDTVFLKTYLGSYLDADGVTVRAHASRPGGMGQSFRLERLSGSGAVASGDRVIIQAPSGMFLSARQGSVQASIGSEGNSSLREFVLVKEGGGPIFSRDPISLQAGDSSFISVKGKQIFADTNETRSHQQSFIIEKELDGQNSTTLNFGQNCQVQAPSPKDVFSDTSLFLRAGTGNLVDVSEDAVHARWADYGGWQKFVVEKDEGGAVESGNTIFLKSHEGNHIDSEGSQVRARYSEHGKKQALKITKDGDGPIHFGDSIFLDTSDGDHIAAEDESVSAAKTGNETTRMFTVEKGKWEETVRFLHIPLSAGMAIEDAALQKDIHWGRWLMSDMMRMHTGSWCSMHHAPPSTLPGWGQNFYRDFENLCVTRHPYDRAVSQYSYMLSQVNGNETLVKTHHSLFKHKPCSSDGLNHYLQTQLGRVLHDDRKYISNCHFVPQSAYIWDGERQWCSHILRMDELPGNFNALMDKKDYSVRLSLDPSNITNSHDDVCPELSVASLTNETRSLLDEAYAGDFRRLGYVPGTQHK